MSYPRKSTTILAANDYCREPDWDAMVDAANGMNIAAGVTIQYPYSFIVRNVGGVYDAISDNGILTYGGSGDVGGIDGDDATAVIQATLDAIEIGNYATATRKGGICFFKVGWYPITQIQVGSHTALIGETWAYNDATFNAYPKGSVLYQINGTNLDMIVNKGTLLDFAITIKDLILLGHTTDASRSLQDCIHFENVLQANINHVFIRNFGDCAIYFGGVGQCGSSWITNIYCNNVKYGIYFDTDGADNIVYGNQITYDNNGVGIYISSARQTVFGNKIWGETGFHGIQITGGVEASQIVGNDISDCGKSGIYMDSGGHHVITGNSIYRCGRNDANSNAIIAAGVYNTICGNNIYDDQAPATTKIGIYVAGNYNVVSGNLVDRMLNTGIWVTSDYNSVSGGVVKSCGAYGVLVPAGAEYNIISNILANLNGTANISCSEVTSKVSDCFNGTTYISGTTLSGLFNHAATPVVLGDYDAGSIHTNLGAGGLIEVNLPNNTPAGTNYTIIVLAVQQINLQLEGSYGGQYYIDGALQEANDIVYSSTVGSSLTMVSLGNGNWAATNQMGTWAH
jgi:hypothetical protein